MITCRFIPSTVSVSHQDQLPGDFSPKLKIESMRILRGALGRKRIQVISNILMIVPVLLQRALLSSFQIYGDWTLFETVN